MRPTIINKEYRKPIYTNEYFINFIKTYKSSFSISNSFFDKLQKDNSISDKNKTLILYYT